MKRRAEKRRSTHLNSRASTCLTITHVTTAMSGANLIMLQEHYRLAHSTNAAAYHGNPRHWKTRNGEMGNTAQTNQLPHQHASTHTNAAFSTLTDSARCKLLFFHMWILPVSQTELTKARRTLTVSRPHSTTFTHRQEKKRNNTQGRSFTR